MTQKIRSLPAFSPTAAHRLASEGMDMDEAAHRLILQDRNKLSMTGVTEVVRFDDTVVVLRTELGGLTIQGTDLQLKTLSAEGGQVAVEGRISGLSYEEPRSDHGLLHRLFG